MEILRVTFYVIMMTFKKDELPTTRGLALWRRKERSSSFCSATLLHIQLDETLLRSRNKLVHWFIIRLQLSADWTQKTASTPSPSTLDAILQTTITWPRQHLIIYLKNIRRNLVDTVTLTEGIN